MKKLIITTVTLLIIGVQGFAQEDIPADSLRKWESMAQRGELKDLDAIIDLFFYYNEKDVTKREYYAKLYVDAFEKSDYKILYGALARKLGIAYYSKDEYKSATYMEKSIDYHEDNESDADAYFVLSEYYFKNATRENIDYSWYRSLEYAKKAYNLNPEYKEYYEKRKEIVGALNRSKSDGRYNEAVSKFIYALKNN